LRSHGLYAGLAAELGVPLEADILAETLAVPGLKSDQIHPNAAGYLGIAEAVARLLREAGAL
jgi:lysophospholipase L1-like esterase